MSWPVTACYVPVFWDGASHQDVQFLLNLHKSLQLPLQKPTSASSPVLGWGQHSSTQWCLPLHKLKVLWRALQLAGAPTLPGTLSTPVKNKRFFFSLSLYNLVNKWKQIRPTKINQKKKTLRMILNALHISQQVSDTTSTEKYPYPPRAGIWPATGNTLASLRKKRYIEIKFL